MSNSFTRKTRAAPYFQILSKLVHVDLVQEDEVPEADIGVEGHGAGLGHKCHSCHGAGDLTLVLRGRLTPGY